VKALQLFAFLVFLIAVVVPFVRRRAVTGRPRPAPLDELVKDPVCQTYIVRSRAVAAKGAAAPLFCSVECARRWAGEPGRIP